MKCHCIKLYQTPFKRDDANITYMKHTEDKFATIVWFVRWTTSTLISYWLALNLCASGVFLKLMPDLRDATSRTHHHHRHAIALSVVHAVSSPSPSHFLLLASSAPTQTSTVDGVNQNSHRDRFTKLNSLHTQWQFPNKIEQVKFQSFDLQPNLIVYMIEPWQYPKIVLDQTRCHPMRRCVSHVMRCSTI